jgi:membrane-associated protein
MVWGVTMVLLGYAAGASYARVEQALGRGVAGVVLVVVIAALVVWRVRDHRRGRRRPDSTSLRR